MLLRSIMTKYKYVLFILEIFLICLRFFSKTVVLKSYKLRNREKVAFYCTVQFVAKLTPVLG